jgi:hypothetical protein
VEFNSRWECLSWTSICQLSINVDVRRSSTNATTSAGEELHRWVDEFVELSDDEVHLHVPLVVSPVIIGLQIEIVGRFRVGDVGNKRQGRE